MKTLYLDCGMGAAGDMLAAALLELLPDPAAFVETLRGLGLPGVGFTLEKSVKCGVTGSHLAVTVAGQEEGEAVSNHILRQPRTVSPAGWLGNRFRLWGISPSGGETAPYIFPQAFSS